MRRAGVFAGIGLLVLWLGGCERQERQEADREAESAAERTERALEEAGKDLERGAEVVGEKAKGMARDVGEATEDAARDVGEGAREAGRDAKELGTKAADKAGEAASDVGEAAEQGAREVGRAGERTEDAAERALTPGPVEPGAPGQVGAERGLGAERVMRANADARERLESCDLSQPLYFFFEPGSANVAGGELTRANKLAGCLAGRAAPSGITVVAYGDTSTDPKRNAEVGLDRASNVARILIRSGAPPKQVTLQAVADTSPEREASGQESASWARRVAVRVGQ
jgi:outer membrane protein OmpA-like peptidoglycan-associated protein